MRDRVRVRVKSSALASKSVNTVRYQSRVAIEYDGMGETMIFPHDWSPVGGRGCGMRGSRGWGAGGHTREGDPGQDGEAGEGRGVGHQPPQSGKIIWDGTGEDSR